MGFLVAYSIMYSTPKKFQLCPSYFDFSVSAHIITAWIFTLFCVHNFFITPKTALKLFKTSQTHVWAGRIGLLAGVVTVACSSYTAIQRHVFGVVLFVPESKEEVDTDQCPAAKSIFGSTLEIDTTDSSIINHKISMSESVGLYIAVHHFSTMIIFGFLSIRKYRGLAASKVEARAPQVETLEATIDNINVDDTCASCALLDSGQNITCSSETKEVDDEEVSTRDNALVVVHERFADDEDEESTEQMKKALNIHIICMKWLFVGVIFQPSLYFFKYVPRLVQGCPIFEAAVIEDGSYCSQIGTFTWFVWVVISLQFLVMFLLGPQTFQESVSCIFKIWFFMIKY